jgi:tetratricopeptide (TPR) repeat protein
MVGREEAALAAARAGVEANRGSGRAMLKPYAAQVDDERLRYIVDSELGDHIEALKHAQAMMALPRWGGSKQEGREFEVLEIVLLHDVQSPLLAGMPTDLEETRASNASVERHGRDEGYLSITGLLLSAERGAWRDVVADGEGLRDMVAREAFLSHVGQQVSRRIFPILALAYEHLGHSSAADALLEEIPTDVYDGWRARARVALLRHDYPLAGRDLAEAVRQAPSLPYAYSDWGDLLAAKNDSEGAVSKYAEAQRRGPHFADPIKAWGDVLAKQGRSKEALVKYDEALEYAPNWAALKEKRGSVAKH